MAASTGGLGAVGAPAALGLLVLSEAAVPIPFPADLLMLLVGERAAAGALPLWAAALGLEAATVIGTTALFLALRGPARAVIPRIGPRVGLTEARIARSCEVLERRGRIAVALGRGTPGLRTLTVAASAVSGMRARWVLPALVVGASAFVQLHLVMGYVLGEAAREALESALPVVLVAVAVALVVGLLVWRRLRGRERAAAVWAEASCPACLALGAIGARVMPLPNERDI